MNLNVEPKEAAPQPRDEELARHLYDPRMPYHNFAHALRAVGIGAKIVEQCRKEGVEIDGEIVRWALLFHDAGYHEDHRAKGFSIKEEYSAHLAGKALEIMGVEENKIEKVKEAILATRRDAETPKTNEAKAVRAADLAGLAGSYETFLDANRRLKEEAELLRGRPIPREEWREETRKVIEFYLGQDIRLTSSHADESGQSIFHQNTRRNLERFLKEF